MRFALLLISLAVSGTAYSSGLRWEPLNEPGSGGWLTALRVNPKSPNHMILGGDMLGLGTSKDGGQTWNGGFGLASWEIGDVTFHPKNSEVVWAGTMSGPVVSRDGGVTWESKRKGLPEIAGGFYSAPIQKILIDPANTDRLLAFAGSYRGWESPGSPKFGYVWESLDGGESWHDFSAVRPYRSITWVDADRDWKRLYAVVQNRGVSTSDDRGKTWKDANTGLPEGSNIRMVAVHPTDANTAWAAAGNSPAKEGKSLLPGGIYQTTDGGLTWNRTGTGLPARSGTNPNFTTRFQAIAVSPADPLQLATSDTSWDHNAVYHSGDGGATWTQVLDGAQQKGIPTAYPAGMGATVITFDPVNPDVFFIANSETVLRTGDRGKSWSDLTASPVAREPVKSWRGHGYSGLCSTGVVFNPFRPGSVIITSMDAGKHLRSDDDLAAWTFAGSGFSQPWGGANDAAFAKPDGQIVYLAVGQHGGQGAVGRTDDGGRTWKEFQGPAFGLPSGSKAEASAVHCDPDKPDYAWAIMGRQLFSTEDGGKSWRKIPEIEGATKLGKINGQAFPFYVGGKSGIFLTRDGRKFDLMPGSPASPASIRVMEAAPDHPYAVKHRSEDGGVFRFDGNSWKRFFDKPHASDIAVNPQNPKRLAVATNDDPFHDVSNASGVWISEDAGATWQQSNDGLSCLRGLTIAFDPHRPDRLIFGSFGRGFFQTSWPASSTAN